MAYYDIPIDFCPKCNNKRIRIVMGKTFEVEHSLSGKCIRRQKPQFADTTYLMLKCTKCGWLSQPWNEAGLDVEEWDELQKIYLEKQKKGK